MTPPAPRCDAAVWDVDGSLTADVLEQLHDRQRTVGKKILCDIGVWRDRRVVVGRPRRMTAAMLPPMAESLCSMQLAYGAKWLVVVGPGAAWAGARRPGEVLRDRRGPLNRPEDPGLVAAFASGSLSADLADFVAIGWSGEVADAARRLGTPFDRMAAIVRTVDEGPVVAPPWRPQTSARTLGRWVGRLVRPANSARGEADPLPGARRAVREAIEALLSTRTAAG